MIEFKDVSKSFKDKKVLDNVSFNIEEGEFVCIIGGSGCGKTTALKMINKLILPTDGTIYVNGKDISKENEIELRRNIGYVIQQTGLFPHMTVRENIELIPKIKNKRNKEKEGKKEEAEKLLENVRNVLTMVGLDPDEYMDKYPVQMSGGQQQRVGVARAFASNPDIILKSPANDFVLNFVGKKRIWDSPELIKAEDIMIENPIVCISRLKAIKAQNIMREHRVDSLMVIDENRKFLGKVYASDASLEVNRTKRVLDIMDTNCVSVSPRDSIVGVLNKAKEFNMWTMKN